MRLVFNLFVVVLFPPLHVGHTLYFPLHVGPTLGFAHEAALEDLGLLH